jgi:hypothetical protein
MVEVVLGEADRQDQCAKICVKCGGGDADVHVVWAIPMPWRKATAMQEAGCFPVVVGFGATGEDSEMVWSVGSRVDGIYPYLPLVAVSDSVVGGLRGEVKSGVQEGAARAWM